MTVLLKGVEVGRRTTDVRLRGGVVEAVGALAPVPGEEVVEGHAGALLPGLHDHHLHLLSLAAAATSVDVSDGLAALRDRSGTGWLRAVGWAGEGDRRDLDAVVADRPVRVQHRGGSLWVVNSAGARELGLASANLPGVERDEQGEPTGRLWRLDAWVSERLGRRTPDLAEVGTRLAGLGITGVTDATPDLDRETCDLLRREVPQRLLLLGDGQGQGPVKVVLPDHDLPSLEDLVVTLRGVRPRPVAVHCVTREALLLLLAAWDEVGQVPGDRIEHGALVPEEVMGRLGVAVVTQPGFLLVRGDDYLRDLEPHDVCDLYRYGSLLRSGVTVVPSSDAPYGPLDPWAVLRAARDRTTGSGRRIGPGEAVPVEEALAGMLRPLSDLAAAPRAVRPGVPADLVLLHTPLDEALDAPDAALVRATWLDGRRVA